MATTQGRTNSLYVGDLNPEVSEGKLMEIFSTVGHINSLRLCRDHHTQRSLGYAYINYNQPEHAEKALKTLNFTKIDGRPCRVMWVHRDPWLRKSGKGNIFVKNLPPNTDNKGLFDMFKPFGEILSVKVPEKDGKWLTYGFVHFKDEKAATEAIAKKNGEKIGDVQLLVAKFLPQKERAKDITNLYVKPLPKEDYTDKDLMELFKDFGEISSCKIAKESDGTSKGFGFVDFKDPEDAKKAIDKLNNIEYKGKKLFVGPFQPWWMRKRVLKEQREKDKFTRWEKFAGTNVYVKNLSDDIDEKKLNAMFAKFGEIKSSMVKIENGIHRGFGFVNFGSQEAATKAVTAMNKQLVNGKLLYVSLAQSKEERMRKLQDKYNKQPPMQGVYPGGAPQGFIYPQPGQFPGRPVFITQPMVRPRYYGGPPQAMGRIPNQMMMGNAMRGGRGRGGQRGRKGQNANYKLTANARNHQQMQGGIMQVPQHVAMVGNPQQFQMQRQQQMMANQMAMRMAQQGPQGTPQGGPAPQSPQPQPQVPQGNAPPNLTTMLEEMDEEGRKQTIGEMIYPKIQARLEDLGKGDQAPKITGMLLDLGFQELLGMIPNDQLLNDK
eukprot:1369361-Amorphochlora_amoeboformis.AAC.2